MKLKVRVGKRFAIYLPKRVVEKIGISEGDELILNIKGEKIELSKVHDPIELALKGKKFAKVSLDEVEEVSLAEQKKKIEGSA